MFWSPRHCQINTSLHWSITSDQNIFNRLQFPAFNWDKKLRHLEQDKEGRAPWDVEYSRKSKKELSPREVCIHKLSICYKSDIFVWQHKPMIYRKYWKLNFFPMCRSCQWISQNGLFRCRKFMFWGVYPGYSIEKFTARRVNSTLNFTRITDIALIASRFVRYRLFAWNLTWNSLVGKWIFLESPPEQNQTFSIFVSRASA